MSNDNGDKTEVELKQERQERYKSDPDKFIELDEIVTCVIRTPQGLSSLIKGSKLELQIAYAELNQKIMTAISRMEMEKVKKAIIPGGILNFARRK